jgi:hypothetical protein
MKTLKQVLELYTPDTKDGKAFVQKHVIVKTSDGNGNGDDVFNAAKVKKVERKKERHGYDGKDSNTDKMGDDEKVYEAVKMFADFINEGSKEDVEMSADYKEVIEPDGSVRKVRAKKAVLTKEMNTSMAYAIGTKSAMKSTGDKPPLEKSTITKAHKIAKSILKKEDYNAEDFKSFIKEHAEQMTDEELDLIEQIYTDLDEEEAQTFVSVVEAGELDSFLEELNKALEE